MLLMIEKWCSCFPNSPPDNGGREGTRLHFTGEQIGLPAISLLAFIGSGCQGCHVWIVKWLTVAGGMGMEFNSHAGRVRTVCVRRGTLSRQSAHVIQICA